MVVKTKATTTTLSRWVPVPDEKDVFASAPAQEEDTVPATRLVGEPVSARREGEWVRVHDWWDIVVCAHDARDEERAEAEIAAYCGGAAPAAAPPGPAGAAAGSAAGGGAAPPPRKRKRKAASGGGAAAAPPPGGGGASAAAAAAAAAHVAPLVEED